jgi:serine/threonine-protein kinase
MKKTALSFCVFFVLQSCSQNELVTHKSNKGFSFSYSKKEWILEDNKDILLLFSTNQTEADFKTNINILVQDLSMQPMSLNEYHQLTLNQIKQATGENNVENEKDITISGYPTKELIYHIPQDINRGNTVGLKIKQVYLIKENKSFLVTYTAKTDSFNKDLESANKVFRTFEIH